MTEPDRLAIRMLNNAYKQIRRGERRVGQASLKLGLERLVGVDFETMFTTLSAEDLDVDALRWVAAEAIGELFFLDWKLPADDEDGE